MKHATFTLMMTLCLALIVGACALEKWQWEQHCTWHTAGDTQVYIPGTSDVITTLPAGTSIRTEDTVGDTWQSIEYMEGGRCRTGMVRAGSLVQE